MVNGYAKINMSIEDIKHRIQNESIDQLVQSYPFLDSFLESQGIDLEKQSSFLLSECVEETEEESQETRLDQLKHSLTDYIQQMLEFLGENQDQLESVTILPGKDKSGNPENFNELVLKPGEIICIVGPTGSGKSRLLGDIEWIAQEDTPTERKILINGKVPEQKLRFSPNNKLVAQLSQNMNFVIDLKVGEFLELHAESRLVENPEQVIQKIIEAANDLSGETFDLDTPVTSLSGGQSRALMIADTAILSKSPIVLIDEIENAGIDRKKALEFLLREEKIVLMATHDPMLALLGNKRLVIRNGGIHNIIETSDDERTIMIELEAMDQKIQGLRKQLRSGEKLVS